VDIDNAEPRKLKPRDWRSGMLFWAPDPQWLTATNGAFPRAPSQRRSDTQRHPAYLEERVAAYSFEFRPCSGESDHASRYIRGGTALMDTGYTFRKDTRILDLRVPTRPHTPFASSLNYLGVVPVGCILPLWSIRTAHLS
jgi:hypothetical protein